jgi:hypothetical protein
MVFTLARFECSGFLPVETPKNPRVYIIAPVDNEEALHHRIVDACQTIRTNPAIFERMRQSMRVKVRTESHGHFEHLL